MTARFFRKRSAIEERDFDRHPDIVRPAVHRAVQGLGWQARTTQSGAIEAVWTSSLFRLKGDVRVQILTVRGVTRVRIESISRRGGIDFGENVRAVQEFFQRLDVYDIRR